MLPPCCSEPRVASPVPSHRHPHPHPSAQHPGSQGRPRTHHGPPSPRSSLPGGSSTSSWSHWRRHFLSEPTPFPRPTHCLVVDQAGHHPPPSAGDAIINMTKIAVQRPSLLPHPLSLALERWFSSPAAHRNHLGNKTPVPGPHPTPIKSTCLELAPGEYMRRARLRGGGSAVLWPPSPVGLNHPSPLTRSLDSRPPRVTRVIYVNN